MAGVANHLDQTDHDLVVEVGDQLHHVADRNAGAGQMKHQLLDPLVQCLELIHGAGFFDVEHELMGRVRLQPEDIGIGDDAAESARLIHDSEPVNVVARHAIQRFVERIAFSNDHER